MFYIVGRKFAKNKTDVFFLQIRMIRIQVYTQ